MKLRFFHILFFFLFSSLVFSAEKSKRDTFSIDEVYVTRVRPAERDISAASLQSLASKDLEIINGNTAADAVKNLSGIIIKDYGGIGGFKTVMVRSLGANHTGVFVDGVQLSDAATGQIDLGKISIENAESVSLVIGQFPDLLQPARMYASASVLNIKTSNFSKIAKPMEWNAGIKTGSFGLVNPSINLRNKWNERLYSNISTTYSNADGTYPFKFSAGNYNEIQYRKNSEIEYVNINTDIFYKMPDSSAVSCKIYLYNSLRGLPGAVVLYNPYSSQQLWNQDFFTNIKYEKKSLHKLQMLSNIKFSRNYLRYSDEAFLNYSGIIDNRYTQHEYYLSQAFSYLLSKYLKISLSTDFFVNNLIANIPEFAYPIRYSSLTAFSLNYNLGKLETHGSALASIIREETRNSGLNAAPAKNIITPSIGASYLLLKNPSFRVRFLYKDIFRMPTFNDLYYTQIGNVNLNPERAKQISIGFSSYTRIGVIDYISFRAEVYQNIVKDKIVAVPSKNLFIWSMRNIGKVDIKGFESNFGIQDQITKYFMVNLSVNYSFQQAIDLSDPQSSSFNQQIPYIPYENLSGLISFQYDKFSFAWNSMFNGHRYVLGQNIYENMLPSWWLHDVNCGYKLPLKTTILKLKMEINNIFDKQYEVVRSFPMPGRSYSFSLVFSY